MPSRCRLTLAKTSDKQMGSIQLEPECIILDDENPVKHPVHPFGSAAHLGNTVGGWSKGNTVAMAERF